MGPIVQRGHDGIGPYCALWGPPCNGAMMGPQNTMGPRWDGTLLCTIGTSMQWGHDGMGSYRALWELPCSGDTMGPQNTMGPQWDGTLLCAMGTAMQWGCNATPQCNGATMGWDPIVCSGDCHAMGTQWNPKTQWGHDGTRLCSMGTSMQWGYGGTPKHNGAIMGWDPIARYGDCHAMGP